MAANAQMGMTMMKTHREMLRRTVTSIYDLFQTGQIENLVSLIDKEARLDCNAWCDYNPFRGMCFGRGEIREWLTDYRSAVEITKMQYQIIEVDEARGTVLTQVVKQGKHRLTNKPFTYTGWDMTTFRNGRVCHMKFWGDDREYAKAAKTPAIETAYKMSMAFFQKDQAAMKQLCGAAKMKFLSNSMDPKAGEWTMDQWMELMKRYDWQYTQRRMIFGSKNHVILEYKCSQWSDMETGQSLMGHRPEFFRFYVHVVCNDAGKVKEGQMHMTPQPSGFLFAKPNGGASKRGLVQHVMHSHRPRPQGMYEQSTRMHMRTAKQMQDC